MAELEGLKISEENKKYIMDGLSPTLEGVVAECIHIQPRDPVSFMLQWMEAKKATEEDRLLLPEERERLEKENKSLEEQLSKVSMQMQETAKLAQQPTKEEDEEEDDDDEDEEPPPDFFKEQTTKARTSVSAEAYGEWNTKKAFVPPVLPKSEDQKSRLRSCLCDSFLFASLEPHDLNIVIGAMSEEQVESGKRVINQGENGDFLFVVESGELECVIKSPEGEEKVVKTCVAGDVFGELALLYNCPRAASVQSKAGCVLWRLDRDTFNHIVKDSAQKKRQRYDAFLSKVPILASMDAYERSQIADALQVENFGDQQTVVTQGETGLKFYIIEEGEAVATRAGVEVMQYGVGDYFGELALLIDQPRAATVICRGPTRLLSLNRVSFKRLLKVDELLARSTRYNNS